MGNCDLANKIIIRLEYYLSAISKYYNLPTINIDGIFGSATENSVVALQKEFGVDIDGIVGPKIWDKIIDIYRKDSQRNLSYMNNKVETNENKKSHK